METIIILCLIFIVAMIASYKQFIKMFQKSLSEGDGVVVKLKDKDDNEIVLSGEVYKREGDEVIVQLDEPRNHIGFIRVNISMCHVSTKTF